MRIIGKEKKLMSSLLLFNDKSRALQADIVACSRRWFTAAWATALPCLLSKERPECLCRADGIAEQYAALYTFYGGAIPDEWFSGYLRALRSVMRCANFVL